MNNIVKWSKIIEENRESIITKAVEMHKDALSRQHLRLVMCINEDGAVSIMEDVAGGNAFKTSVFNGTEIEVLEFCFRYFEGNIEEELEDAPNYINGVIDNRIRGLKYIED